MYNVINAAEGGSRNSDPQRQLQIGCDLLFHLKLARKLYPFLLNKDWDTVISALQN